MCVSSKSFAGVGDVYVCKEKELNPGGYKAEFNLYWYKDSFKKKDKKRDGSVDTSNIFKFYVNDSEYFISLFPYQNGYVTISFDGYIFTTTFVKKNYTFSTNYNCIQF